MYQYFVPSWGPKITALTKFIIKTATHKWWSQAERKKQKPKNCFSVGWCKWSYNEKPKSKIVEWKLFRLQTFWFINIQSKQHFLVYWYVECLCASVISCMKKMICSKNWLQMISIEIIWSDNYSIEINEIISIIYVFPLNRTK